MILQSLQHVLTSLARRVAHLLMCAVKWLARWLVCALNWFAHRPAYLLLCADDGTVAREHPGRFARCWAEMMLGALICGLALAGVWGWLAWEFFHGYELMAMATLSCYLLWPFRRSWDSLSTLVSGGDATAKNLTAIVLALILTLCFLTLKPDFARQEGYDLPSWIDWIRPHDKVCRVLVLMPLWGVWAMLITPQFTRPAAGTPESLVAFARGCGPFSAAISLALPLAGTIFYFHYLGTWAQVKIPAAAFVAAVAGGLLLCRRAGGLNRQALLANNMATQFVFLMAYLANR